MGGSVLGGRFRPLRIDYSPLTRIWVQPGMPDCILWS